MMRRLLIVFFVVIMSVVGVASDVLVEVVTSMGQFTIMLNKKEAPVTVKNFLTYVDKGLYDGTIFHRVIDGFMIQGGGFDRDMKKRPTEKPIRNESHNKLSNVVGTIAMARTNDPNSATSQFYINVSNNVFLNYQSSKKPGYCVFGRVVDGMTIINKIKRVKVGNKGAYQNVPLDDVVIKSIRRIVKNENDEEEKNVRGKSSMLLPTID